MLAWIIRAVWHGILGKLVHNVQLRVAGGQQLYGACNNVPGWSAKLPHRSAPSIRTLKIRRWTSIHLDLGLCLKLSCSAVLVAFESFRTPPPPPSDGWVITVIVTCVFNLSVCTGRATNEYKSAGRGDNGRDDVSAIDAGLTGRGLLNRVCH